MLYSIFDLLNEHQTIKSKTMKYLPILLIISGVACAQKIDYNTIILPKTATDVEFAERLVQLAWQNSPNTEILRHELNESLFEVKEANRNWLDNVRLTGNLNEYNIKDLGGEASTQQLFFPKYNISASFSLGTFFGDPIRSKIQKEGVQISMENINAQKLALRAEVLSKYETYLSYEKIFKLKSNLMTGLITQYNLTKKKFENDEVSYVEYSLLEERYNQEQISLIQAQRDFNISRIEVEELIGVKLSDVQK